MAACPEVGNVQANFTFQLPKIEAFQEAGVADVTTSKLQTIERWLAPDVAQASISKRSRLERCARAGDLPLVRSFIKAGKKEVKEEVKSKVKEEVKLEVKEEPEEPIPQPSRYPHTEEQQQVLQFVRDFKVHGLNNFCCQIL